MEKGTRKAVAAAPGSAVAHDGPPPYLQ